VKADGPRYERETIIRFDDESDDAVVWTASDTVYRRLLKRGWKPKLDSERHAEFVIPKSVVRLPRQKRKPAAKPRGFAAKKVVV